MPLQVAATFRLRSQAKACGYQFLLPDFEKEVQDEEDFFIEKLALARHFLNYILFDCLWGEHSRQSRDVRFSFS